MSLDNVSPFMRENLAKVTLFSFIENFDRIHMLVNFVFQHVYCCFRDLICLKFNQVTILMRLKCYRLYLGWSLNRIMGLKSNEISSQ